MVRTQSTRPISCIFQHNGNLSIQWEHGFTGNEPTRHITTHLLSQRAPCATPAPARPRRPECLVRHSLVFPCCCQCPPLQLYPPRWVKPAPGSDAGAAAMTRWAHPCNNKSPRLLARPPPARASAVAGGLTRGPSMAAAAAAAARASGVATLQRGARQRACAERTATSCCYMHACMHAHAQTYDGYSP